jgi:hypothetical protein
VKLTADHTSFLQLLVKTWPSNWRLPVEHSLAVVPSGHPLAGEINAFAEGTTASLPFFIDRNEIAWFTLAPCADELRSALEDLRAWLLPSFAWEDPRGLLVSPEQVTGTIGSALLKWSPAGYCRWRCGANTVRRGQVVGKLRLRRRLIELRPQHAVTRVPSLVELRQRFVSALAVGDRESAQAAVDLIDRHELDSADNTLFMKYRSWALFGEWSRITSSPELDRFVQIRSPKLVQTDVITAFHSRFLADAEQANDRPRADTAYRENVHDPLTALLARTPADSDPVVQRVLAYRARHLNDADAIRTLLSVCSDEIVREALCELTKPTQTPQTDNLERWLAARRSGDWQQLQQIGMSLVEDYPEISAVLHRSLEIQPNEQLAALLCDRSRSNLPTHPTTWLGCVQALRGANFDETQHFLENRTRQQCASLTVLETTRFQTEIDELFCDERLDRVLTFRQMTVGAVTEFISDLVATPDFPRSSLGQLYLSLLRLWSILKRGSASVTDGGILLELAEAVLQLEASAEKEVGDAIVEWWRAHPAKVLLPFLLDAVELLDRFAVERQCENLWIEGAVFVRSNFDFLSEGERHLWRHVGQRIKLDAATLDEYCPVSGSGVAVDPLRAASIRRISIVSLRERQAHEAADVIRERTGATVDVVTETVAGASTVAATNADVVLFVWSASTHAVFRAFDGLDRQRLAYVSGTGSASIVRALERWVLAQERGRN